MAAPSDFDPFAAASGRASRPSVMPVPLAVFAVRHQPSAWPKPLSVALRVGRFCGAWAVAASFATTVAAASNGEVESIRRLVAEGHPTVALESLDSLLAARPKDPSLRFMKGVLLADAQRVADAQLVFERLTEDFPDLPEPYNNLAVLYAGQGDFERARTALSAALRANPRYGTAQANLGDVQLQLARLAYQRALELAPGDAALSAKLSAVRTLTDLPPTPPAPASSPKR